MRTRSLLALATLAVLPACGRKADPLPPLRRTPPAPTDFRFSQRGDQLELEALAPGASIDGVAYADRVDLEFLYGSGEVDLEKRGQRRAAAGRPGQTVLATLPLPAPGTLVRAAARAEYSGQRGARSLTKALVVQPPLEAPRELQAGADDEGVHLSWQGVRPKAVEPPPTPRVPGASFGTLPGRAGTGPATPGSAAPKPAGADPTSAPATFAPATTAPATAPPPPSGAAPAVAPTAPPGPSAPAATAGAPATGPGGAGTPTKAGEPASATTTVVLRRNGFHVYRRSAAGQYRMPLEAEPLDRRNALDDDAPMDAPVCYVVRAVASTDPLIESAPSNEVCVERRDTTAPATPAGLAILPRSGGLEVLWSPSAEADLAGYRVYREVAGQPKRRLAELGPEKAAYLDETAAKGAVCRYTVTSFDRSGNESEPTDPVEATLP